MNPLFDEKIVAILSKSCRQYITTHLQVSTEREAYGPSKNEGLCYEVCQSIDIIGEINATMYFCMDGYTRMKLIPRMSEKWTFDKDVKGMIESMLLEFTNHMGAALVNELVDSGFNVDLGTPQNLDHKLVPIDLEQNREYIIIFFLRDRRAHEYLGRIYFVLTIKKY